MNVLYINFLVFLLIILLAFYILREEKKWICLLVVSIFFVATYNPLGIIFLVFSAWSIWKAADRIQKNYISIQNQKDCKKANKAILRASIIFNIAILFALKYVGGYIGSTYSTENPFKIFIPIGLSYYTLQAIGYVMDVYWRKIPAEQSFFKVLLFLSYFPQMIQGPINRYGTFSNELYNKSHLFQIHNIKFGVQKMLWGYFKVLIIGMGMQKYVNNAFYGDDTAYGFAAFLGLVAFGFQLYGNFSGGIDIVQGVSQCFDITLPENFRQPFFSESIGDFWRRWHISLGSWMKDYVFFPLSMSSFVKGIKKKLKNHVCKKTATRITLAITNIVVFLIVGIWHGTGTNYALWGLYNGIILAFSELMIDYYKHFKTALHINDQSKSWKYFSIFRTFLLVTIGWCTDCAITAGESMRILQNMFLIGNTNIKILDISLQGILMNTIALGLLLSVDCAHEKGISIRSKIQNLPILVQMLIWAAFIQLLVLFYRPYSGGFMYANF